MEENTILEQKNEAAYILGLKSSCNVMTLLGLFLVMTKPFSLGKDCDPLVTLTINGSVLPVPGNNTHGFASKSYYNRLAPHLCFKWML